MVIKTKKELRLSIMIDNMMNRGSFKRNFFLRLIEIVRPDYIMSFLRCMRKLSYYKYKHNPIWIYYHIKYHRLGLKLGFSIGMDVFGYGLVLPHYGTIVVGPKNRIGNYAVLHVSSLITSSERTIGDNLFVSAGAKITSAATLGNNITIAANSVLTKSVSDNNLLLVGMPAVVKAERDPWFENNEPFESRIKQCEEIRKMFFPET